MSAYMLTLMSTVIFFLLIPTIYKKEGNDYFLIIYNFKCFLFLYLKLLTRKQKLFLYKLNLSHLQAAISKMKLCNYKKVFFKLLGWKKCSFYLLRKLCQSFFLTKKKLLKLLQICFGHSLPIQSFDVFIKNQFFFMYLYKKTFPLTYKIE